MVVDGWRFEVEVEPERPRGRSASAPGAGAGAAVAGRSRRGPGDHPRSGRRRVRGAGDDVEAGQQLLVVEAMKMQNELRSPRDGTSSAWRWPRADIEVGDLLVVIS